jgi:hypothetical protein
MVKDDLISVAGNVLLFTANASEAWRKDVVNSALFSSKYASTKADRFSSPHHWYNAFNSALSHLKWNLTAQNGIDFVPDLKGEIELKNLVQNELSSILYSTPPEHVNSMMSSIELPAVAHWITEAKGEQAMVQTIESDEGYLSIVSLQLGMVLEGPCMCSVFVSFKTWQPIESNFTTRIFSSEDIVGEVCVRGSLHVLDKDSYERNGIRDSVITKLPVDHESKVVVISTLDADSL